VSNLRCPPPSCFVAALAGDARAQHKFVTVSACGALSPPATLPSPLPFLDVCTCALVCCSVSHCCCVRRPAAPPRWPHPTHPAKPCIPKPLHPRRHMPLHHHLLMSNALCCCSSWAMWCTQAQLQCVLPTKPWTACACAPLVPQTPLCCLQGGWGRRRRIAHAMAAHCCSTA
jgi:hypothetical protein